MGDASTALGISVGQTEVLDLTVSLDMVMRFARLTGDCSSLHTDSSFARKSMYRETVAHGMLPLTMLLFLQMGNCGEFEKLSARFLKPVFVGDRLSLTAEVVAVDELTRRADFSYSINASSGPQVTAGTFTLRFHPQNFKEKEKRTAATDIPMIVDRLTENSFQLEQINKGDEAGFAFRLFQEHAMEIHRITQCGLNLSAGGAHAEPMPGPCPRNFLAASVLSTFVGICRPGRYATFLEFSISFSGSFEWSTTYRLSGVVGFVSRSTRVVAETISIRSAANTGEERAVAVGKMKTKVNELPRQMPSLHSLRELELDLQLKGKVVLITGASGGIGETTAKLFSLHGAQVVIHCHRGKDDADRISREITCDGGTAMVVQADITDRNQVHDMLSLVGERFGPVDVLVNNAARDFMSIKFLELNWEAVEKDLDVVVKGAFHCCQAVIPHMIERGGGKIINVITLATDVPPPGYAKYVIAKSGLIGLSRSLAIEFAPHNIQVNMVSPSFVDTNFTAGVPMMFMEKMKNETPMRRNASSVDVARSLIFLASSLSSFTTGQRVMVTGGHPPYI